MWVPTAPVPMVGFGMYEIDCGVGLILRLMIDRAHQRKGLRVGGAPGGCAVVAALTPGEVYLRLSDGG